MSANECKQVKRTRTSWKWELTQPQGNVPSADGHDNVEQVKNVCSSVYNWETSENNQERAHTTENETSIHLQL